MIIVGLELGANALESAVSPCEIYVRRTADDRKERTRRIIPAKARIKVTDKVACRVVENCVGVEPERNGPRDGKRKHDELVR